MKGKDMDFIAVKNLVKISEYCEKEGECRYCVLRTEKGRCKVAMMEKIIAELLAEVEKIKRQESTTIAVPKSTLKWINKKADSLNQNKEDWLMDLINEKEADED